MQARNETTLPDRVAIAAFSAIFGVTAAAVIWLVVALVTSNPTIHATPFVFASGSFAVAALFAGPPFADALGIWFRGMWTLVNALAINADPDLDPRPFWPLGATCFLVAVGAVTVRLSLA